MSNKFHPGDLVHLNEYGFFITTEHESFVGIIISESYTIRPPVESESDSFYTVYDILLDGELIKMVPEEFMEEYKKHEKDTC